MKTTRLEAFSDGVLAIIITIMVLELKIPHGSDWESISPLLPVLLSYILSFINIGIYWGNHHHLLHTVHHVNSKIMWANLHLLFWLSLVPFATAWMGENRFDNITVAVYAGVLNFAGLAYYILQQCIRKQYTVTTALTIALKKQTYKGIIALILYSIAIPIAFVNSMISAALIIIVAVIWLIPDKNIERAMEQ